MFDFGLTLPFVAVTFLTMMAVLNALWYAPVGQEIDERNAKLLQTLSEATDMLTKADEIQVTYTEQIREAREKASEQVKEYRAKVEKDVAAKISASQAEADMKASTLRAKLEADVEAKKAAAFGETIATALADGEVTELWRMCDGSPPSKVCIALKKAGGAVKVAVKLMS